jgi:hypothetical protein
MRDLWRRARLLSGDDRNNHDAGWCGRPLNVLNWKVVLLYDVCSIVVQVDDETITGRMVLSLGHASDTTRQRKEARCARGQGLGNKGGGGGAGKSGTTRRRAGG